MDRHRAERHERNSHERRNQHGYKHAMEYDYETALHTTTCPVPLDSDEFPFGPRDKNYYIVKPERQNSGQRIAGKTRPTQWEKLDIHNTPVRETTHISTSFPSYPRYSEFSGMISAELVPETASPGRTKHQREAKRFFSETPGPHVVDKDGDVLMTDADSKEAVTESSGLGEVKKRLTELEFANKALEIEVKGLKAKLSKSMRRIDAIEHFAKSGYRQSRRRQFEGW